MVHDAFALHKSIGNVSKDSNNNNLMTNKKNSNRFFTLRILLHQFKTHIVQNRAYCSNFDIFHQNNQQKSNFFSLLLVFHTLSYFLENQTQTLFCVVFFNLFSQPGCKSTWNIQSHTILHKSNPNNWGKCKK